MEQILGQDRAIDLLQMSLQSGRMHHAWIFHGPTGVGKFTTAMAVARVMLCHQAQTDLTGRLCPCGTCPSCALLANGDPSAAMHPDLHVITKELARYSDNRQIRDRKLMSIPVGVLRTSLLEPVYRAARLQHNKVFIVDEAELLQDVAQNLLLKTLEEPPAGTFLILVTSHEHRLLPTIRSRCQRVAFIPLSKKIVAEWLARQPTKLKQGAQDGLMHFANGSIGRAQLVLDYDLDVWANLVVPAIDVMTKGCFDPTLGQKMAKLIDEFAKQWVNNHPNASKDAANRQAAALMWALIAGEAQHQIAGIGSTCDPADPENAEAALNPWLGVIDAIRQAERHLATNVNLGLTCDHLISLVYRSLSEGAARRTNPATASSLDTRAE